MSKKLNLDELFSEALENAREDRDKTRDALEKLKDVFNINFDSKEGLDVAMLIGNNYVKLLEQLTRSNEQIVRLAQLKEREDSHNDKTNKREPINIQDILEHAEELEENDVKIRVDDGKARKKVKRSSH